MLEKTNPANVTEHELSEIRALIEKRSGILFDTSRERFFSTRVREHMSAKRLSHGTDLLRVMKSSNRACCWSTFAAAGFVASRFSVRCMRSWRPFCCGCPGLIRSI